MKADKIFIPVSVEERLPEKSGWYFCINSNALSTDNDYLRYAASNESWYNENTDCEHPTHFLEEKQNVYVFTSLQEAAIEFIKEMQKKIDGFAEKETSDFNKGVYYSHFGDLNTAISVLEMYNERRLPTP